jgi:hypothetical protein
LFREEKQIWPKIKGGKKDFFQKDIVVVQAGESNKGITG